MDIPKPEFLIGDAADEWNRIMRTHGDLFTEADLAVLSSYCESFALKVQASREMEGKPLVIAGANGNFVPHPLIGIRNRAATQMTLLAVQLGLTPKARNRIASKKKPKSPLDP